MGNLVNAKAITFLDVETTHLDSTKSAILQITIITDWENGKQDKWTTKIKPRDMELEFASNEALKICKYNTDEWEDAPYFEEVAETIVKKLTWGPLVAHNIQFDMSHLSASLSRRGWQPAKNFQRTDIKNKIFSFGYPLIDTCALAYLFIPTQKQNLNTLREHFDLSTDNAHSSDSDTEHCREIFYNIIDSYANSKN
jgi:DNA polymerase III alpha subunit (gram-positive type)